MGTPIINIEKRTVLVADATLLLVAFLWGTGVPFTADLVRTLTPVWGSAIRMAVAGAAMVLLYPRKIFRATAREIANGLILAVMISSVYILVGFALVFSTPSKQSFFMGTTVIMVPFLVWLVSRKRPPVCVFWGAVLGAAGVMVMGFAPGMRFNIGDAFNLLIAFISAWHTIFLERMVKESDPTTIVALQLPFTGLIMLTVALVFEPVPALTEFTPAIWGKIAFTGLITTVVAFNLQARAQKNTSASHAAIILAMESVFGYAISVLSGMDPFIAQGAVGGALIMLGVLLSEADTIRAGHEVYR